MEYMMKVILITTDNHTLGIQSVAAILREGQGIEAKLFYLSSHLEEYPSDVLRRILDAFTQEIETGEEEPCVLFGFHLKELSLSRTLQLA
jgi:hypothetical protein